MKLLNLTLFIFIIVLQGCTNKTDQSITTSSDAPETPLEHTALFKLIKEKDSLLFQIGFNKIDTAQVHHLTAMDFEFYHDEHGITDTKVDFINNINGIRDLPFKTWRTLVEGSMEVFPLYKENSQILYGAIQNGIHDFYQQNKGEEARKTNTARFTHVWTIENENWKLKRVLSYDHQIPK